MAEREGQQLGTYRLERLLGKGGFAEVYLGTHIHLNTQAAIKVLHAQLASAEEAETFRTEARTVAALVHPHIVRVLDFDLEDETPFLVMDYAPHGSLRQRLPQGTPFPARMLVPYVKQIAEALQFAHNQKLIHRDVKPENMLLGRQNEVLLSDFGIALVTQSTSADQSVQGIAGTTAYMAPEQLQGHPRPASDQYSLGVVLYQWLSGAALFQGSYIEVASQHVLAPPPPLRQRVPTLSPAVEQVVMIALAKDPKDRFASVLAFAHAFEQACQSEQTPQLSTPPVVFTQPTIVVTPSDPSPPFGVTSPSDQVTSRALTPPGQITPALSINTGQGTTDPTLWQAPIAPSALSDMEQVTPNQPASKGISRRLFVLGLTGTAVAGGAVTWVVLSRQTPASAPSVQTTPTLASSTTSQPTSGVTSVVTAPPQGTLLYRYTGHTSTVNAVAWSPNGQRIASASWDHTVQVWDAANGGSPLIFRGHSREVNAVAWSPNGRYLASASFDKTVQVWDANSGQLVLTYPGHKDFVNAVAWSHDGKRLASGSGMATPTRTGSTDTSVQVWDATTGATLFTFTGHTDSVTSVDWSPDNQRIASGSWDHTVQVWNAADGGNPFTYSGHTDHVWAALWSPGGQRIASGSKDATVQVWNAADGGNPFVYHGHSQTVFTVAWSPGGQLIASGSHDDTAQVWNAADGGNPFIYRGHTGNVNGVAWSPDGQHIASVSDDATVQVWQAV